MNKRIYFSCGEGPLKIIQFSIKSIWEIALWITTLFLAQIIVVNRDTTVFLDVQCS